MESTLPATAADAVALSGAAKRTSSTIDIFLGRELLCLVEKYNAMAAMNGRDECVVQRHE